MQSKTGKIAQLRRGRAPALLRAAVWAVSLGASAVSAGPPPAPPTGALPEPQILSHGLFKDVHVYRPAGAVKQFVLFLSGDGGWARDASRIATELARGGAMVAGIDDRALVGELERKGGPCVFPDGDLENLSHFVQAYYRLSTYLTPVLAGHSAGASLAYAVGAQAPRGLFAGVLTLGFTAEMELTKPLCKGVNVHFRRSKDHKLVYLLPSPALPLPWINLTGSADAVCPPGLAREFVRHVPGARMVLLPGVAHDFTGPRRWRAPLLAALASVAPGPVAALPPPPATLAELPIVEVPATGRTAGPADQERFAVLLSGDGGWAGIDKEIAQALAARGIPVAGLDSLRYFWSPRTPQGLAQDLDRIVRYYAAHWGRRRALLVGYSQGADVLPFAVNRLPPITRSSLDLVALIGLGRLAAFEFHISNWIASSDGLPIAPEMAGLSAATTVCIYGKEDSESICPQLGREHARVIELSGGHHFGGDYDGLAHLLLEQAELDGSRASRVSARRG